LSTAPQQCFGECSAERNDGSASECNWEKTVTTHIFTSFTFSYLDRARVLAWTLRRQHPDWTIWAVITDKEPDGFRFDLSREDFDRVLYVEDLFPQNTEAWLFQHGLVEACTAVKARALLHIMESGDAERIVYLDPDIAVFNPLDPVMELLDQHSIVVTPHQVDPEPASNRQAIIDNEIATLQHGDFNLGFLAVNNDEESRRLAKWWDERLTDWCFDRLDLGIFVDQKWCNLVPCFFDGVKVLRDPGYNVASWNISRRKVSIDSMGNILANDVPLRFFHFTKLGSVGDTMTRRYAGPDTDVHEIWWWYRHEVERRREESIPQGWWHYGSFENGDPIPIEMRRVYRDRKDLQVAFSNPRCVGAGSFHEWFQANVSRSA
jgi:hypothetical protein